jgi:hypothetical protein
MEKATRFVKYSDTLYIYIAEFTGFKILQVNREQGLIAIADISEPELFQLGSDYKQFTEYPTQN